MKIISVTGTKGKTSTVRTIAAVLSELGENTLRADSDGYYINEVQKGNAQESKDLTGNLPTISPGKFLITMADYYPNFTAILEAALGCFGLSGLGYRKHQIGIFTNVYDDHIGSLKRLATREDIAETKSFIFSRIGSNGYGIYNAQDKLVCSQLKKIPKRANAKQIAVGIDRAKFCKTTTPPYASFSIHDGWVVLETRGKQTNIVEVATVPWTFDGKFEPSVYTLLFSCAAIWANYDEKLPSNFVSVLQSTHFSTEGGRLVRMITPDGVELLLDSAHEKQSLLAIGKLAHQLSSGKIIGVVRMPYDRTDKLLKETAQTIANSFDEFIVYDKIDGYYKKPLPFDATKKFVQKVGYTSKIFATELKKHNSNTHRIIREDEALEYARSIAKTGDCVVHIVNENIPRSVTFVEKIFQAKEKK
jgi:UDP-N-acetylmuramyl tripeptide synthase